MACLSRLFLLIFCTMKTLFYFIAGALFLFALLYVGGYLPFSGDRGAQNIRTKAMNMRVTGNNGYGCASCKWS